MSSPHPHRMTYDSVFLNYCLCMSYVSWPVSMHFLHVYKLLLVEIVILVAFIVLGHLQVGLRCDYQELGKISCATSTF